MNESNNQVPWWFPDASVLAFLVYCTGFASAFIAISSIVQSIPYGVAIFSATLGISMYWITGILLKHFRTYLSIDTKNFLSNRRSSVIIGIMIVPAIASWAENESFKAALNPIVYWTEELHNTTEKSCDFQQKWLVNAAEELQVAQNKYSMGIATTSDVTQAIQTLSAIRNIHQQCMSDIEMRNARARARIATISEQ